MNMDDITNYIAPVIFFLVVVFLNKATKKAKEEKEHIHHDHNDEEAHDLPTLLKNLQREYTENRAKKDEGHRPSPILKPVVKQKVIQKKYPSLPKDKVYLGLKDEAYLGLKNEAYLGLRKVDPSKEAYRLNKTAPIPRGQSILKRLKTNQDMIVLQEIIGTPKGLRPPY